MIQCGSTFLTEKKDFLDPLFRKKNCELFLGEKNSRMFFWIPPPSMCFFSQPFFCAFFSYGVKLLNDYSIYLIHYDNIYLCEKTKNTSQCEKTHKNT